MPRAAATQETLKVLDPLPRALLSEDDAARYLAIGKTTLRTLGIPRRVLGARRLYDVRDLNAFRDSLPYEGEDTHSEEQACDAVFGSRG